MAALINALDNYTEQQIGENSHIEYGWSNSIQEKILQFSFQVTRTKDNKKLQTILKDLLIILTEKLKISSEYKKARSCLSILYKIIAHTRDIIDGKGEYNLAYMMIYTWYDFFPELAFFALSCFVDLKDYKIHQYGSWKDIKYFCNFCKENDNDELILFAIKKTNNQLKEDENALNSGIYKNISLVAKWIPRENSSFGWLYESFATDYFKKYLNNIKNVDQKSKAILKCKTHYRKLLSTINRQLDTLQIKQCKQSWSKINFDNVTSISIMKQKKAFLNIRKNGEQRYNNEDRNLCSTNFKAHINKAVEGENVIKGKRVSMENFTKEALNLLLRENNNDNEINLLNSQWKDNSSQTNALGNMIAMVDVSGSMDGDPLNVAIALGIRISEKNKLGKRIMTFSNNPKWVDLTDKTTFVDQVKYIKDIEWNSTTNFYAAFDLILNSIIQSKISHDEVENMILVILSDMQINESDTNYKTVLYDTMKEKYENTGIKLYGKPFKLPHIIFWNLRQTNGFPCLSSQPNCSMISGFSPTLLNEFCNLGLDALKNYTPWSNLKNMLNNERYKIMSSKFDYVLDKLCEEQYTR